MKRIITVMLAMLLLAGCGSRVIQVESGTVIAPTAVSAGPEATPTATPEAAPTTTPEPTPAAEPTPDPTEEPTTADSTAPESREENPAPSEQPETGTAPESPEPTPAPPEATPEPTPVPVETTPQPAVGLSYGAVPFELAANSDKWWKIDPTDTAYWAVQENINAIRASVGLGALSMDESLSAIASSRCESFVVGGPFDHSGMVTKSEICASGPLFSASAVCTAWQNSDAHYAAMTRPDITRMGVGCWFCVVDGNKFTYWTVTFE